MNIEEMLAVSLVVLSPAQPISSSLTSVYLGVNDKKVSYLNTELLGDKRYEHGVDWGLVHHLYLESVS